MTKEHQEPCLPNDGGPARSMPKAVTGIKNNHYVSIDPCMEPTYDCPPEPGGDTDEPCDTNDCGVEYTVDCPTLDCPAEPPPTTECP